MDAAQGIYRALGFVRCPERDVPYEVWREDPAPELPAEWIDQPFLAYAWGPADG
jgi:ribosomal protein S18 acetylase RimI-like enzyme